MLGTRNNSLSHRKDWLLTWHEYVQPLIDAAVPHGLLDFVDFHALGSNLTPEVSSLHC